MPHLIERLLEIGLTQATGAGIGPITWGEIDAWCNRTRIDLDPWESRLIHRLSTIYVAEGPKAEVETCPPPWRGKVTAAERQADEDELRAVLG